MDFDINRPELSLDDWQKDYIASEENCFLLCGRQIGKSTGMSIKAAELAVSKYSKGDIILMIALTERQAYELFFKTLNYLQRNHMNKIMKGAKRPTKHEINLSNGVKIICLPTGLGGQNIRGYTIKHLFIDEGARISDDVFTAVRPMLSVTGGKIDIASTPCGKQGFFFECSKSDVFKKFYVSAEDCPRHKKEFLESEKGRMSALEYAQEYLAVFLDELKRFFNDELIKKVCVGKRPASFDPQRTYFLGVDVARMGEDECRFEMIDRTDKKKLIHVENLLLKKVFLNEVYNKIIELEKKYCFRNIYIDSGGIGVGVSDYLLSNDMTKRKTIEINNRDRATDYEEKHKKKMLKEDLYNNLLGLMERGEIVLLDDDDIVDSLKSVQYEYLIKQNQTTQLRIFGNYTHIVEGLIRAAWCAKDKRLNIWVR